MMNHSRPGLDVAARESALDPDIVCMTLVANSGKVAVQWEIAIPLSFKYDSRHVKVEISKEASNCRVHTRGKPPSFKYRKARGMVL